ncbi:hypothetical protein [Thiobacillus sp.]|uniref:hypothetical protein n=1 Tax=Thiobacillus sp. TaxID=924 RepID=UPI0025F9A772|nr:hypothetical protein [Thiobacillus sp.]MBT9540553.1 hypothetical protein [Thiobacillus sp.]
MSFYSHPSLTVVLQVALHQGLKMMYGSPSQHKTNRVFLALVVIVFSLISMTGSNTDQFFDHGKCLALHQI